MTKLKIRNWLLIILLCMAALHCNNNQQAGDTPVYLKKISSEANKVGRSADSLSKINPRKSLEMYKKMIAIARQQKDDAGLVEAYRNAVFIAGTKLNETDTALKYSNESIALAHRLGDANTLCSMYGVRAVTYQAAGLLDSAIAVNKLALQYMYADNAPDSLKNWPLYVNIAGLYNDLKNQPLAIEFTNKYLDEYVIPIKDTDRMVTSYSNLSFFYTLLKDTAQSNANIYKAYHLMKIRKNYSNESVVYDNMIALYLNKKQYDSALYFGRKAMEVVQRDNNSRDMLHANNSMMEIAYRSKDSLLALELLNKHLEFNMGFDESLPLKERYNFFDMSYKLYEMLGVDEMEDFALEVAYNLSVELREQEINKDLVTYELERKRVMRENELLASQLKIKNKNNTILLLLSGFLVVFLLGAGIVLWYRRRAALHKKQVELLEKERKWEKEKSLLEGQLEERNRISRELHDDLGASLTSIALAGEIMKKKNTGIQEDLHVITASANNMVDMLNEIVWSLNSRNDSLFGLVAYIRKFTRSFLEKTEIHTIITDDLPAEDRPVSSIQRRAIYLTAKEAINNIVKHSGAHKVQLHFTYAAGILILTIKDDGKGLSGESNKKGGNNGLLNMSKNMEMVHGHFEITEDNGVKVTIACAIND